MKKIWKYLKQHLKEDFHAAFYITIFIFLAICITLNYQLHFYRDILSQQKGIFKFLSYFLFYAFAYFFAALSYLFYSKQRHVLKTKIFWVKSLLLVGVISLDHSLPFLRPWIQETFATEIYLWTFKVLNNLVSLFTVICPLLLFYYFNDRKEKHIYGLQAKHFDVRPYFIMLLCMAPLIIGATFNKGFLIQYPMYKVSQAHVYLGIPEWLTVAIYEIAYAFDFVSVEFLFRGFMVIGMMTVLGRGAVLSMATAYCFLHFGKPAGEAISSIFGGYLLGVIAYETKSIWGGIIVHIGIAWSMEIAAFMMGALSDDSVASIF